MCKVVYAAVRRSSVESIYWQGPQDCVAKLLKLGRCFGW